MQWLLVFLVELVSTAIKWFIGRGVRKFAVVLGYITVVLAAYIAFVTATYAAVFALKPVAPPGINFALAFLPPTTPLFLSAYMTALIARRLVDFKDKFTRAAVFNPYKLPI